MLTAYKTLGNELFHQIFDLWLHELAAILQRVKLLNEVINVEMSQR